MATRRSVWFQSEKRLIRKLVERFWKRLDPLAIHVLISAGTVAEALIVFTRRNVGTEMTSLIDGLGFEIVTVTPASARRIAQAYERWGKSANRAALNFRRLLRL